MTSLSLAVETVPVASLEPWPGNPRTHDLDALRASLKRHGQYRPLVVQKSSRKIMAGNGTWEAAAAEGWETVEVTFLDVDDEHAARIMLVDNRLSDLADYDNAALIEALSALPDLGGTGYTDADLGELINALADDSGDGTPPFDAMDEWHGLPEFDQHDLTSYWHCVVHFTSDEHAEEFFRTLGRPRKKTMWWPESDGHIGMNAKTAYTQEDAGAASS